MFTPTSQSRIWLCTRPIDMRKSFDGLSALVRNQMGGNPVNGDYFIFINRRQTHMKILYFDVSGFCLWAKRLEQGQFRLTPSPDGHRIIRAVDLQLLLEGIEIQKARRFKRYCHGMKA